MPTEHVETLIVGGGQAGLTMSHMLSRRGRPHLVLERGRMAERWRSERWHGLRFQFPNWSVSLPQFPFRHSDPDGFATSEEIVAYLEAYARVVKPAVRCGVSVTRLRRDDAGKGFVAETSMDSIFGDSIFRDSMFRDSNFVDSELMDSKSMGAKSAGAKSTGSIFASTVVIATGPYQRPVIPELVEDVDHLFQVHASAYKRPEQLPAGAVLVVGSGASGAQIAEELLRSGRRVYLSVGRHKRMPRRYRGRDLIWWLEEMGLDQTPVEKRGADATLPLITGAYGGHTVDFRSYAQQGITLLGRLEAGRGRTLKFAADLGEALAWGDAAYDAFLDSVDAFIERHKMRLAVEPAARKVRPEPPCVAMPVRQLDIRDAGLSSVIWATGYAYDFGWIDLPVLDARGRPRHEKGVAHVPGLYFLGLPWLSKMNSSFLSGVGDDADRLADHIQAATQTPP